MSREGRGVATPPADRVERVGRSRIQHGPFSDRVYLMALDPHDLPELPGELLALARTQGYGKVVAKAPASGADPFLRAGFEAEARVPDFFGPGEDGLFLASWLHASRRLEARAQRVREVLEAARERALVPPGTPGPLPGGYLLREATPADAPALAACYDQVFLHYPFPIEDPAHLRHEMAAGTRFFGVWKDQALVAAASMEPAGAPGVVEMTDFATLPAHRGRSLAVHLLAALDRAATASGHRVACTIARAFSFGMNITFSRRGYRFAGTLVNNTRIADGIESMNVWYRPLGPTPD